MSAAAPLIEFKNVELAFGKTVVHKSISFKIQAGESVTILGPSGSGKTQILKMIIGLTRPTKGEILIEGREIIGLDEEELVEIRREVGMLFQGAALFDSLSVKENIAYSLREQDQKSEEEIEQIVAERLKVVGLSGIEHKTPPQLSGGQKKRVGLARALASSPRVMLFDEPTTGLDPTSTRMIDDLIRKLQRELGITCISVTHDIESAKKISDRWLLINNGVIAADGAVTELSQKNDLVLSFISGTWKDDNNGS